MDFALWRAHGERMARKLTLYGQQFNPATGLWEPVEMVGPPSFDAWWKAFLVLRTALLMLDMAFSETLDNYGEWIRELANEWGPELWW